MFPNQIQPKPYDFRAASNHEWFVDKITGHHWDKRSKIQNLKFEVQWSLGDTTWESYESCKELEALDRYLEVHSVECPAQLARLR